MLSFALQHEKRINRSFSVQDLHDLGGRRYVEGCLGPTFVVEAVAETSQPKLFETC